MSSNSRSVSSKLKEWFFVCCYVFLRYDTKQDHTDKALLSGHCILDVRLKLSTAKTLISWKKTQKDSDKVTYKSFFLKQFPFKAV